MGGGGGYLSLMWRLVPSEGKCWPPTGCDQQSVGMPSPGHRSQKADCTLKRQLDSGLSQVKLGQPARLWEAVDRLHAPSEDLGSSLGGESATGS